MDTLTIASVRSTDSIPIGTDLDPVNGYQDIWAANRVSDPMGKLLVQRNHGCHVVDGGNVGYSFFSFLSKNAQGDAGTGQRRTALTRGTHRPHSTHKVSAIRPETSSKKQWSDKDIVLVAMVGQANHCIQQHVALAQLPLGAHLGVGLGSNKALTPSTMRSSLYGCYT